MRKLIKKVLKALACFSILIIPCIWNLFTTILVDYNYLAHYLLAVNLYGVPTTSDPIDIIKAFILGHFPYAIIGLLVGFLFTKGKSENLRVYCLLLPAITAFLVWPCRDLRIAAVSFYATMIVAGYGMELIIDSLAQKPILNRIGARALEIIIFLTQIIISVVYAYTALGFLSPPWSPHDFSPKVLSKGLNH